MDWRFSALTGLALAGLSKLGPCPPLAMVLVMPGLSQVLDLVDLWSWPRMVLTIPGWTWLTLAGRG